MEYKQRLRSTGLSSILEESKQVICEAIRLVNNCCESSEPISAFHNLLLTSLELIFVPTALEAIIVRLFVLKDTAVNVLMTLRSSGNVMSSAASRIVKLVEVAEFSVHVQAQANLWPLREAIVDLSQCLVTKLRHKEKTQRRLFCIGSDIIRHLLYFLAFHELIPLLTLCKWFRESLESFIFEFVAFELSFSSSIVAKSPTGFVIPPCLLGKARKHILYLQLEAPIYEPLLEGSYTRLRALGLNFVSLGLWEIPASFMRALLGIPSRNISSVDLVVPNSFLHTQEVLDLFSNIESLIVSYVFEDSTPVVQIDAFPSNLLSLSILAVRNMTLPDLVLPVALPNRMSDLVLIGWHVKTVPGFQLPANLVDLDVRLSTWTFSGFPRSLESLGVVVSSVKSMNELFSLSRLTALHLDVGDLPISHTALLSSLFRRTLRVLSLWIPSKALSLDLATIRKILKTLKQVGSRTAVSGRVLALERFSISFNDRDAVVCYDPESFVRSTAAALIRVRRMFPRLVSLQFGDLDMVHFFWIASYSSGLYHHRE